MNKSNLQQSGVLTAEQINRAQELKSHSKDSLGQILIREGFITESKLLEFIGKSRRLAYIDVDDYIVDPKVTKKIPVALARKYNLTPLFEIENVLTIATSRQSILQLASKGVLTAAIFNKGGKSLRNDGFKKVLAGVTTVEEVLSATQVD